MRLRRGAIGLAGGLVLGFLAPPCLAESLEASCARVGDDDRVQPLPQSLTAGARAALGFAAEAPDTYVLQTTVYRCMDGVIRVCTHGANLTCARADVARVSPGADAWCKDNPGASDAPAYATGHDTIYRWTCAGTKAVAGQRPRSTGAASSPTSGSRSDDRGKLNIGGVRRRFGLYLLRARRAPRPFGLKIGPRLGARHASVG